MKIWRNFTGKFQISVFLKYFTKYKKLCYYIFKHIWESEFLISHLRHITYSYRNPLPEEGGHDRLDSDTKEILEGVEEDLSEIEKIIAVQCQVGSYDVKEIRKLLEKQNV